LQKWDETIFDAETQQKTPSSFGKAAGKPANLSLPAPPAMYNTEYACFGMKIALLKNMQREIRRI
jgi:hypothetical protein